MALGLKRVHSFPHQKPSSFALFTCRVGGFRLPAIHIQIRTMENPGARWGGHNCTQAAVAAVAAEEPGRAAEQPAFVGTQQN